MKNTRHKLLTLTGITCLSVLLLGAGWYKPYLLHQTAANTGCTYQVNFSTNDLKAGVEQMAKQRAESKPTANLLFANPHDKNCSSCDVLACDAFNYPELVMQLNRNFINVDMKTEVAGNFNLIRAMRLGDRPAGLFVRSNNQIVDIARDIRGAKDILMQVDYYNKKYEKTSYGDINKSFDAYAAGNRDALFLHEFAMQLKVLGLPYNSIINEYLNRQPSDSLSSKFNRSFYWEFSDNLENKAIEYFLRDLEFYKAGMGSNKVNDRLKMSIYNTIATAIAERDDVLFKKAVSIAEKAHIPYADDFIYYIKAEYYEGVKDWNSFTRLTIKYIDENQVSDPQFLQVAADKFYLYAGNRKELETAYSWAKKSYDIWGDYESCMLLANISRKLLDCDESAQWALKAIEIARRTTIDYTEATRLLDNIRARGCKEPNP